MGTEPDEQKLGTALLCDSDGTILRVVRDDLGIADRVVPGQPFVLLVDRGCLWKALDFLVDLQAQKTVFDRDLNFPIADQLATLHVVGAVVAEGVLIAAGRTRNGARQLHQELAKVETEQFREAIDTAKEESRALRARSDRDSMLLDSITRLTNELLAVQGERAHKNVELQRVNARLTTLLAVSRDIVSTLEPDPPLNLILEQLQKVIDYTSASILKLAEDMVELWVRRGTDLQVDLSSLRFSPSQIPLIDQMIANQRGFCIPDIQDDAVLEHSIKSATGLPAEAFFQGGRSWMAAPLIAKSRVIGMLSLVHSQPGYYEAGALDLLEVVADGVAIAIENARLYRQAQETAVMSERARLARELHDSLAQPIYSMSLYVDATRLALSSGKTDVADENVEQIGALLREAMSDMRLLTFELRPSTLEEEGLVGALQDRLEAVEQRSGLQTALEVEGKGRLPLSVEADVYRIAQEALNNVVKHAQAAHVSVQVRFSEGQFSMVIEDDGKGFDLESAERSGGMGLRSMRERARQIAAELTFKTEPGKGTTVSIEGVT